MGTESSNTQNGDWCKSEFDILQVQEYETLRVYTYLYEYGIMRETEVVVALTYGYACTLSAISINQRLCKASTHRPPIVPPKFELSRIGQIQMCGFSCASNWVVTFSIYFIGGESGSPRNI